MPFKTKKWHDSPNTRLPSVANLSVVSTMSGFDIEVDPWDDTKWALGATAIVLQASLSRNQRVNANVIEVKNRLRIAAISEVKVS